jgi:hypothetical protein
MEFPQKGRIRRAAIGITNFSQKREYFDGGEKIMGLKNNLYMCANNL